MAIVSQDLATAAFLHGAVSIRLGNGDGTFQVSPSYAGGMGSSPDSIAVGDFNGDGRQDLTTADDREEFPGTVSILLGQGDGTFEPVAGYSGG